MVRLIISQSRFFTREGGFFNIIPIHIGMLRFTEWLNLQTTAADLQEMAAARRSFGRTMGKFQNPKDFGANYDEPNTQLNRPIAIISAFRKDFDLDTNREANKKLAKRIRSFGLSWYPVIGAGQEEVKGVIQVANEESLVIQPVSPDMGEEEFLEIVKELLFDPTGEGGPSEHTQWGALVKLPSQKKAFLLHHDKKEPEVPESPADYDSRSSVEKSARPRRGKATVIQWQDKEYPVEPDDFYTQMVQGPAASDKMRNPQEPEFGKEPEGVRPPGRRFTISRGKKF